MIAPANFAGDTTSITVLQATAGNSAWHSSPSQGWLASKVEETGQKQAAWRTDPARSGASGCLGDIGTHAQHIAYYVTGLRIAELCAELTTFVPGRALEDDGNILLRFEGGAKGILHASQIAVGEENNLNLRVYGTKASIEWRQESPHELTVKFPCHAEAVRGAARSRRMAAVSRRME